jgi:hypothetical protein
MPATSSIDRCPTPLDPKAFHRYLKLFNSLHQFPLLVPYLSDGFPIGNSMPSSLAKSTTQKNYLKSPPEIKYAYSYFLDEVQKHRMLGPLTEAEVQYRLKSHFRTSPVGLVPKAGKPGVFRVIRDLSHSGEAGWSINNCIDSDRPTIWTTFDEFANR